MQIKSFSKNYATRRAASAVRQDGLKIAGLALGGWMLAAFGFAAPAVADDNDDLELKISALIGAHNLALPFSFSPDPLVGIPASIATFAANLGLKDTRAVFLTPVDWSAWPDAPDGCSFDFELPQTVAEYSNLLGFIDLKTLPDEWGELAGSGQVDVVHAEPYFDRGLTRNSAQCCSFGGGAIGDSTCLDGPLLTRTFYDDVGRVTEIRMPFFNDGAVGLTRQQDSVRTTQHLGLLVKSFDEANHETSVLSDLIGRSISETAENDGVTQYVYDSLGQLKSVNGPIGDDNISMVYDTLGNKERMTDPDKGAWRYVYNALGELLCQSDARGAVTMTYRDTLGRETQRVDGASGDISAGHCGSVVFSGSMTGCRR